MIEVGDRIRLASLEMQFVAATTVLDELGCAKPVKEPKSGASTGICEIPDRITEPPSLSTKELSHAELQIVIHIRRGMLTLEELGAALHRSPNTVRKQLESVYKKLNVHSRHELIAKFLTNTQ